MFVVSKIIIVPIDAEHKGVISKSCSVSYPILKFEVTISILLYHPLQRLCNHQDYYCCIRCRV